MKSACTLLLFSFWLAAALAQRAPIASFTVGAGATNRLNTPVSASLAGLPAPLPEAGLQLVERREGQLLPVDFQIETGSEKRLTWILSGDTPAGTERVFELRHSALPDAAPAPTSRACEVSVLVHPPSAGKKILIYTKNGEGYVHENRAASVVAIRQLAEANGIEVVASDDPAQFNDAYLKQFDALVFSNTNNATFDTDEQKLAFQRYIQAGGGFVGVHIACGSERQWPWFSQMVGGRFRRHPKLQPFDLRIIDPHHVSTRHLPPVWHWEDECYFIDHLNPDIHVLMAADLRTVEDNKPDGYPGITFGNLFPLSWYHTFDGGRQWYSALGHKTEYYSEPLFLQHLLGGITWAVDHPPLDYSTVTETLLME